MDIQESWQPILILGGEGGSVTILGKNIGNTEWVFKKRTNEVFSFKEMDNDQNIEDRGTRQIKKVIKVKPSIKQTMEGTNWEDAITMIEEFPLEQLSPKNVHPFFNKRIWDIVSKRSLSKYKLKRWAKACFPTITDEIFELYEALYASIHTVVLTGAGMSVESGIPDFRSKSGWWKNIDPLTVATVEALEENYDLFHEFYTVRLKTLGGCKPHEGHHILGKWEKKGLVHEIATQNVDGFHTMASSSQVDQLHGSIRTFRCHQCGSEASLDQFINKESCSLCNGKLRPNVVLFGEMLPEQAWNNALNHMQRANLVIVIGTSLKVYPVSQLPQMTNGKTIYINKEVNDLHSFFDLTIEGSAKETLSSVDQLIR
ncbi:NAD-dependent deacylase [Alkalihalobacterium elongatum]|uniref:NAD-dependent deacylase n=1 Tax=Alkalihalobacterium elongatum TaxID=2675466 RepID=UPI002E2E0045|nr:NAD-dependent deacylase [Alkalihalobacterium elongatum]